jgi:hypothetical protein
MINSNTVGSGKTAQNSVRTLLLNTLFSQSGEDFSSLEPISDREFYSGLTLVGVAILAFGLVMRIIGS